MRLRHLSYPGRQGAGEYRRRSGPPEELVGSIERELRVRVGVTTPIEIRASEDGDPNLRSVVGHAAVFDRLSEELGIPGMSFRERVRRGAFRKVLDEAQDTVFLIEHDSRWPLARTRSGTLELSEDPRGLRTFAKIDTRQSYAADLIVAMERRDVDQMSFGFVSGVDEWLERRNEDGSVEIVRDLVEIERLFDVSAVTFPAYPQTDVGLRAAITVAGIEIVDDLGAVDVEQLRALAWSIEKGELAATAEERALVDAAFSRTDTVSPWTAQRALRAVALEPELRGAVHEPEEIEPKKDPNVGDAQSALAARRLRLSNLTS